MARLKAVPFQNSGTFSGPKGRVSKAAIFHGLKPVASTAVPLARDPFAQGIKRSLLLVRDPFVQGIKRSSPACTGALCAGDRDITPACAGALRAGDQEIQSCLRGSTSCKGSRHPVLLARDPFAQGIKSSGQSARPGSSWPVTSICWFWKALSSSVVPVSRNELVWRAAPFSTAVMT